MSSEDPDTISSFVTPDRNANLKKRSISSETNSPVPSRSYSPVSRQPHSPNDDTEATPFLQSFDDALGRIDSNGSNNRLPALITTYSDTSNGNSSQPLLQEDGSYHIHRPIPSSSPSKSIPLRRPHSLSEDRRRFSYFRRYEQYDRSEGSLVVCQPIPDPYRIFNEITKSVAYHLKSFGTSIYLASPPASQFLKGTLSRFLQIAVALTVIITFLLYVRLTGKFPSSSLVSEVPDQVWFTNKFRHTIPDTMEPSIALWNQDANPKKDDYFAKLSKKSSKFTTDTVYEKDSAMIPLIAEFHTHTNYSDGSMSPEQVVDWAIAYGFHVLFVTDHNNLEGGLKAQEYALNHRRNEILVIPGIEYTCCRIHMNLVGLSKKDLMLYDTDSNGEHVFKNENGKKVKSKSTKDREDEIRTDEEAASLAFLTPPSSNPSDEDLKRAIDETHRRGGLVFVNHIPWSLSTEYSRQVPTIQRHPTLEQLVEWGVDGTESVSGGVLDLPSIRFTEKLGMPYVTATDLHSPDVVPTAWTVLNVPRQRIPRAFLNMLSHKVNQDQVIMDTQSKFQALENEDSQLSHIAKYISSPEAENNENAVSAKEIEEASTNLTQTILNLLRSRTPGSTNFYYSPIGPPERVYPVENTPIWDWAIPLAYLDFTYFWSENNGMYSFVSGFCHERVFKLHYTRIFAFLVWACSAFAIEEAVRYIVVIGINLFKARNSPHY